MLNKNDNIDRKAIFFYKNHKFFNIVNMLLIAFLIFAQVTKLVKNEMAIEVIMICIFIYSCMYTLIQGYLIGEISDKKKMRLKYMFNALLLMILTLIAVYLKHNDAIMIINKQINDLNFFLVLIVIAKFGVDTVIGFNVSLAF